MSEKITLICPNIKCRGALVVTEAQRGKQVRCGKCGQVVVVPAKPARRR